MQALIRADLVEKLTRQDREIHDTKLSGFTIRCRATGSHVYRLRLGRGQWVTLGRVKDMTPDTARAAAQAVLGNVSKKALATVADGDGGATLAEAKKSARADVRRERRTRHTRTWKGYLEELYAPHVEVHLKRGAAELARLRQQFAEFDGLRLQDISTFAVERWKTARLKAGAAPATVNRDLASLRGALSRAIEWKVLRVHPLADVKRVKVDEQGTVRYLTGDEEKALRAALEARDTARRTARASANEWRRVRGYALLPAYGDGYTGHLTPLALLALNTGCRRGELFALTWADVEGGRLRVQGETAKSGQTRYVPLNAEARKVLAAWKPRGAKPADRVFSGGDEDGLTTIKTGWARLLKAAGLADFRFHDLRHTFASKLVMAGVDLNTVRELLGHADLKMTLRYAHLAPEIKAAAVEKLVSA